MDGEKKRQTDFIVVLVEPKYGGNIGATARSMMNFNFDKLYLVNPCTFDDECYSRAMHAQKLLDEAQVFSSFNAVVKELDYCVATSSIDSKSDKKHLRNPILLNEFAQTIFDVEGTVGLVFGREDYGLYNHEIAQCDIMVKIPTSDVYPSLNLSHAVSLVLYALYVGKIGSPRKKRHMGKIEKEKLYEFFSLLLDEIDYPKHKKENTKIMFQRMMGRALPSKWEYHTFMGVFSKTLQTIKKKTR